MTYFEPQDLSANSKHETIGHIEFVIDRKQGKVKVIEVKYKSGRRRKFYNKKDIPKTVWHFIRNQNKNEVVRHKDYIYDFFFMV